MQCTFVNCIFLNYRYREQVRISKNHVCYIVLKVVMKFVDFKKTSFETPL